MPHSKSEKSTNKDSKTSHARAAARGDIKRVFLIIDTSHASGRDELRGIGEYNRRYGGWLLHHCLRGIEEFPRDLAKWEGDAIIGRIQSRKWIPALRRKKLPIIDMLALHETGWPRVTPNQVAIAKMGFEHLKQQGYKNFAFFGLEGEWWSESRKAAFKKEVEATGQNWEEFIVTRHLGEISWDKRMGKLADWLWKLKRPTGIFICSDEFGPEAIEGCRRAKLSIPADVGLVSVDNDEAICFFNEFSLSSIEADHFTVGYRAAELLHRWFEGERPPDRTVIAPKEVKVRQTSDVHSQSKPSLIRALTYIKAEVLRPGGEGRLTLDEIATAAGASRAKLERDFKDALGKSVHAVIVELRLEKAKELLAGTDMKYEEIATQCGFSTWSYFGVVFREAAGCTPRQYRENEGYKFKSMNSR